MYILTILAFLGLIAWSLKSDDNSETKFICLVFFIYLLTITL